MRRTGKTFRAVLEALKLASEGKQIVYVCGSHDMARWTFDKAARITADFMELERPENLLLKVGNGTVRFVSNLSERELSYAKNSGKYELLYDT